MFEVARIRCSRSCRIRNKADESKNNVEVSDSFIALTSAFWFQHHFCLLVRLQSGAPQHTPNSAVASRTPLLPGNVTVAVYDYVDRIDARVVHGGEIRVLCEDDWNRAWILGEIFLYLRVWLKNVDCQNDQVLAFEFPGNIVDQLRFLFAVLAPGSPELEQHDLAFDGFVVELLASGSSSAEARGRLASFVSRECGCGQQKNRSEAADEVASS